MSYMKAQLSDTILVSLKWDSKLLNYGFRVALYTDTYNHYGFSSHEESNTECGQVFGDTQSLLLESM